MDRITVKAGDVDLSLSMEEAERMTLDLAAALYWARHGEGS